MHEAGIVAKTEDKEYDELEEKFQSVASSVTALKENVASYLQHLELKCVAVLGTSQPQRIASIHRRLKRS